jgi:hypothetical protein
MNIPDAFCKNVLAIAFRNSPLSPSGGEGEGENIEASVRSEFFAMKRVAFIC